MGWGMSVKLRTYPDDAMSRGGARAIVRVAPHRKCGLMEGGVGT